MPRIRTIKPAFYRSEDVRALSYRARLTWVGLWLYADDEGRLRDDPRLVKGDLWALEDDVTWQDVEDDLAELATHDRITRYAVDGKRYIQIRKWAEHQVVTKATVSKIPEPPCDTSPCPEPKAEDEQEQADELDSNDTDSSSTPVGVCEDSGRTTGGLQEDSGRTPVGVVTGSRKLEVGSGSRKLEVETGTTHRVERVTAQDFDRFWQEYPRRVGKQTANTAFARAVRRSSIATVIAGATRLASDPNLPEPRFIPHPATWLNRDGWDDDPLPSNSRPNRDQKTLDTIALGQRLEAEQRAINS